MHRFDLPLSRRQLLLATGASALALVVTPEELSAATKTMHERAIPKSGEKLAIMGMGTSGTFDVSASEANLKQLTEVARIFFDMGGQLVDSSPMYGAAESIVGKTLARLKGKQPLFAATKVWADGKQAGIRQMQRSFRHLGVRRMDLMQIHNLRDWKTHLPTLRAWKDNGTIRYIGITTSHGRFHDELERLLKTEPLDFVQLSYNIVDREVEKKLLPLAQDKGVATLVNRPFQRGSLFRKVDGKPLPEWAAEIDCESWGQFFLKFAAGHPAVTCLIPATSKPKHMADNMNAGFGRLPDAKLRNKMVAYIESL